ncbi:hypothetical protein BCR43DRAFT_160854 [Syncephalastrum racemosum]|uniref:Uncharacterized protein n=1 Tax=Syncephalastrum racemosum TaxID=13706 RepID=A0A1X2HNJ9_SYNRA|nr:hypothetical protein BCR43DRAFT_160854 [Syncephalastrum racemosum]
MLPLRSMSPASPETRPTGSLASKTRRRKLPIRSLECETKNYLDSSPFLNETYTSPSEENKDPSFLELPDSTPIVIGTPTQEGRRSTPRLSRHRTVDLSSRLTKRDGDDFMDLSRHSFVPRNLDKALRAAAGHSIDQDSAGNTDDDNDNSDGDDTRSLDTATLDIEKPYTTVHSSAFEQANVGIVLPEVKLTLPQETEQVPDSPSARNSRHAQPQKKSLHGSLSAEKRVNEENEAASDASESSEDTVDLTLADNSLEAAVLSATTLPVGSASPTALSTVTPKDEPLTSPKKDEHTTAQSDPMLIGGSDDHKDESQSKPKKRTVHFDLPPLPDLEPIKIQEPDYIQDLYETSPTKRTRRSSALQKLKQTTALDWVEDTADTDPRKHDVGAYRKRRLEKRLQKRTAKKVVYPTSTWRCRDI